MAQLVDVLTTVDPMGALMDERVRAALWREIARRPSGLRPRLQKTPRRPGRDERGGLDA
jgi:hypothetical protein